MAGKMIQVGPVIAAPLVGPIAPQGAGQQIPRTYTQTWVRTAWNAPWFPVDYLRPVSAVERAMPGGSEATFVFNFGDIKREDEDAARVFNELRYSDFYVCIVAIPDIQGVTPYTIWCGICPASSRTVHATREPTPGTFVESGDQTFHAFGFDYLLRRRRISGAWVYDLGGGAAISARKMSWSPPFNERLQGGLQLVQGNRSASRVQRTVPSPTVTGSYAFGGTSLWSAKDILEYLLFFAVDPVRGFDKREPEFKLASAPPALVNSYLEGFYPILDQEDSDVWTLLGKIIDRRRGMTAAFRYGLQTIDNVLLPSSNPVDLVLFPLTDQAITIGSSTLPANPLILDVNVDRDIDYDEVTIEQDSTSTYDQVVVKGERCIACLSFAVGNSLYSDLIPAWSAGDEAAYEAATDDNRRLQDLFGRVYRAFKLPSPFSWTDKLGNTLNPAFTADGQPIWVGNVSPASPVQNNEPTLLAELPFRRLSEDGVTSTVALLAKPFALCYAENDSDASANRYIYAEDPPDSVDVTAASVRVRDRESMIEIDFRPNHLHAKRWFNASPSVPAEKEPVFDYTKTIVTLAILCDSRPSVTVDIQQPPTSMQQRTLTIEVQDAHFWFAGFRTVRGLIPGVGIQLITDGRLRDDTDRLRAIAAAARAWYGRRRARLAFAKRRIEDAYSLGTYIATARTQASGTRINSCVTQRRWDFEKQTTAISTEFAELDFR